MAKRKNPGLLANVNSTDRDVLLDSLSKDSLHPEWT
jgi:hypothetical protein